MQKQKCRPGFKNMLFRIKISGESCWPYLVSGKKYWASSFVQPKVGRFAVFKDTGHGVVVKRVEEIKNGALHLRGTVSWASAYTTPATDILGTLFTHAK